MNPHPQESVTVPRASTSPSPFSRAANSLLRRLQLLGLARRYRNGAGPAGANVLTPSRVGWANEMMRWMSEYLEQPHPDLGRQGPVCPFVARTAAVDRFLIALHDEVVDADRRLIRDIILSHAEGLKLHFPETDPNGNFTGLVIVFPKLPLDRAEVLDELQDEMKTHFMSHDTMVAACHARSTKPAINNPAFPAFRSPLPCMILRHMDVRDIVFLAHNRRAFARYHARFAQRFAEGKVGNEFGYVDLYTEAVGRFGKAP